MSNRQHKMKQQAREARQERQARRVVNGIFIGLIVVMLIAVIGSYIAMS